MKRHSFTRLVFWLLACLLLTACGAGTAPSPTSLKEIYYPAEAWRISSPEDQGLDPDKLEKMVEEIELRRVHIDHVTIVRHGYQVLEASFGEYQPTEPHLIYSCTKSVVSALIGIAIDQGYLKGVDVSLASLFPDRQIQNLDALKQDMTLEDMLMMSSGFDCQDSYLYNWRGLYEMMETDDWTQHVLDLPMAHQPGTYFEYCNGVSFLLSAVIQEATGMQTAAFAEENLFGPLGIFDYFWDQDPDGVTIGFSELYLRPADMARIGYLYLHGGLWGDRQVIPGDWVTASTTTHIAATLQDGYGYQWWINDDGYYMALGHRGQFIFVFPEDDMIVVFLSDPEIGNYDLPEYFLNRYIIPALGDEAAGGRTSD
jgi:CubicO group peptidase (beta-lactamase class C family)